MPAGTKRPRSSFAWAIALLLCPIVLLSLLPAIAYLTIPIDAGEAAIGFAGIIVLGYIFLSFVAVSFAAGLLAMNFQRSRLARVLLLALAVLGALGLVGVAVMELGA